MNHTCPDLPVLRLFVEGLLPANEIETVGAHLEDCAGCRTQLEQLSCGHWLDEMLREEPETSGSEEETDCRFALEQLLDLTLPREVRPESSKFTPPTPMDPDSSRFELLREAGVGAFGTVWLARDRNLGRPVALKLLHAGLIADASDRERFFREARSAAQLRHPGIAAVHEVTEQDGVPAIVSEFIDGVTLRELLRTRPLTFRESASLMAQIADALDYAHAMKLVHRDVKPGNIMIELSGLPLTTSLDPADASRSSSGSSQDSGSGRTTPRAVLLDFGLALRDECEATMTADGQILGTPSYMSPEQAAGGGHHVDRRSDVYSAGVVLYELLAGQLPFQGSKLALIHQVLHAAPRSPRQFNPAVPRDLETICLKAMSKDRTARYPEMREFADDLRRWLNGEPILARQIGTLERLWSWSRRNPALAGMIAVTSLVMVIATVVSSSLAIIASRRATRIEKINTDLTNAEAAARRSADEARENARLAEEHSQLALMTLESVIHEMQTELIRIPNAQKVRGQLLKTGLDGLAKLSERLQSRSRIERDTAIATLHLAEVFQQAGDESGFKGPATADGLYQRAVELCEELLRGDPENLQAQEDLANACRLMAVNITELDEAGGMVSADYAKSQSGRPRLIQGLQLFRRSMDIWRKRLKARPEDSLAAFELARTITDWCYLEMRAGDWEQSLPVMEEARALSRRLVNNHPDSVPYQAVLAEITERVADWHADFHRDFTTARPLYEESLELWKKLALANPADHELQIDYANSWSRLGEVHRALGDKEAALAAFEQELAITSALEPLFQDNALLLADCHVSYDHVLKACLVLNRMDRAIEIGRRGMQLSVRVAEFDPEARRGIASLRMSARDSAEVLRKAGLHREAADTCETAVRLLTEFQTRTGDRSFESDIATFQKAAAESREREQAAPNPPAPKAPAQPETARKAQ